MTLNLPTYSTRAQKGNMLAALTLVVLMLQSTIAFGQAKEYVVFSIVGNIDNLTLGQILYEGHKLNIPENATVNLIGKQGETITIKGPTVVTVTTDTEDQEGEEALASISDLLFEENKFVEAIGGTRSTTDETNLEKLLFANDIDRAWAPVLSGNRAYCVKKGAAAIYRETADNELTVEVDGKKSQWKTDSKKLDLSKLNSSVANKSVISMTIDGKKIRVSQFEDSPSSITKQAAWLARNGCAGQALQLLAGKIPTKPSE